MCPSAVTYNIFGTYDCVCKFKLFFFKLLTFFEPYIYRVTLPLCTKMYTNNKERIILSLFTYKVELVYLIFI